MKSTNIFLRLLKISVGGMAFSTADASTSDFSDSWGEGSVTIIFSAEDEEVWLIAVKSSTCRVLSEAVDMDGYRRR